MASSAGRIDLGVASETPLHLPNIGGYEIVGLLGTGGMAQVLLGRQVGPNGFERPVVVKRILPHLVRRQSFVDMFLDEARTIASIRHPNVVNIHDFRHQDGELFMVMEYLEGETTASLRRRLNHRDERMPLSLWCHIFAETCAGLHSAHQAVNESGLPLNLVHRDVSPPNILVTYDGAVKLIDFGIAKSDYRSSQTDAGHIKGKYAYMSPEQARGKPLDARSDIFSLGVVMFELTTGRRLFKRNTELLTVQAVCNDPIPDPRAYWPDYPQPLIDICIRALARDPTERYQSALELRRDLLAVLRADESASVPEELISVFMQDMFEDRIELKRGLLQRVRDGERFDTFSSTTDSVVEVSTLMTGALPNLPAGPKTSEAPRLSDDEVEVTPLPERIWQRYALLPAALAAMVLVVLMLTDNRRAARTQAVAPEPTEIALEFASVPSGAAVRIGEETVGRTPTTVQWPKGETPIEVTLQQDGFEPWTTVLKPSRDVLIKGHLTAAIAHVPHEDAQPAQDKKKRIRRKARKASRASTAAKKAAPKGAEAAMRSASSSDVAAPSRRAGASVDVRSSKPSRARDADARRGPAGSERNGGPTLAPSSPKSADTPRADAPTAADSSSATESPRAADVPRPDSPSATPPPTKSPPGDRSGDGRQPEKEPAKAALPAPSKPDEDGSPPRAQPPRPSEAPANDQPPRDTRPNKRSVEPSDEQKNAAPEGSNAAPEGSTDDEDPPPQAPVRDADEAANNEPAPARDADEAANNEPAPARDADEAANNEPAPATNDM